MRVRVCACACVPVCACAGVHAHGMSWSVLEFKKCPGMSWNVQEVHENSEDVLDCPGIFHI